jgi:hypothetical protein
LACSLKFSMESLTIRFLSSSVNSSFFNMLTQLTYSQRHCRLTLKCQNLMFRSIKNWELMVKARISFTRWWEQSAT